MTQSLVLKHLSEITNSITAPADSRVHDELQKKFTVLFPGKAIFFTPMSATCKKIIGLKLFASIILSLGLIFLNQDFRISCSLYSHSLKVVLVPKLDIPNPIDFFANSPGRKNSSDSPDEQRGCYPLLPPSPKHTEATRSVFFPTGLPSYSSSGSSNPLEAPIYPDPLNDLDCVRKNLDPMFSDTVVTDPRTPKAVLQSPSTVSTGLKLRGLLSCFEPTLKKSHSRPSSEILALIAKLRPDASKDTQTVLASSIQDLYASLVSFNLADLNKMLVFWETGSIFSIMEKTFNHDSRFPKPYLEKCQALFDQNRSSFIDQELAQIGHYLIMAGNDAGTSRADILLESFYTLYVIICQFIPITTDDLKEIRTFEDCFIKCLDFEILSDSKAQQQAEYSRAQNLGTATTEWLKMIKKPTYRCGALFQAVLKIAILVVENQEKPLSETQDLIGQMISFLETYQNNPSDL